MILFNAVVTTDEILLNSVNSTNSENQQSLEQQRQQSAVDEAERRLLDVRQGPTVDCTRLRAIPEQESPFQRHNDETQSLLDSQRATENLPFNLRDINAMSIASIYDREHNEVDDADK